MVRFMVVAGAALSLWGAAGASCLDYGEHHRVTLSGHTFMRIDLGPPGFGETPDRDQKERHYYLRLDHPVCVNAGAEGDAVTKIDLMQMVYFLRLPLNKTWLNKHVAVTGWLMPWQSGHHMTPVLIVPVGTRVIGAAAVGR